MLWGIRSLTEIRTEFSDDLVFLDPSSCEMWNMGITPNDEKKGNLFGNRVSQ